MADIKFRLGLDGKDFDKGLDNAKKKATGWGASVESIGKKAGETFGAKNIFQGLLQGLGIGTAQQIAEVISSGFRKAAEHAKDLAGYTERSLSALQRLLSARRTDEQNLAALQRDQRRDNNALRSTKFELAFSGPDKEAEKRVFDLGAQMQERAVEIEALQRKIDNEAKQRAKELATAQEKLGAAKLATARELMSDEQRLVSLDLERSQAGLDSLNSKTTELERIKAATKEAELQKDIAAIRRKIADDEAKIAEKAAEAQKKRREEAEKLNEELAKARSKEIESRGAVRDARAEQFAFTLADAASGTRGGVSGKRSAGMFDQKTKQLNAILDQGNLQIGFGDDGAPTLTSRDPTKADHARQATGRFRKLFGDREALRGSINNLSASDRDPMAQQKKAYKDALDESKRLEEMAKTLQGKFLNQGAKTK
jgi:hypothetical protein